VFALQAVTPRPLPESDTPLSTFKIVQRENGGAQTAAAAPAATPDAADDSNISVTVTAPPADKKAPAPAPVAQLVVDAASVVPDSDADGAITNYADLVNYIG